MVPSIFYNDTFFFNTPFFGIVKSRDCVAKGKMARRKVFNIKEIAYFL